MAIQDRNLTPGTRLMARYRKQQFRCEVVVRDGGKLGYRLEDGREFKSPSSAGTAITGKACNGWAFWNMETSTAPVEPETETPDAAGTVTTPRPEDTDSAQEVGSPPAEGTKVDNEFEMDTTTNQEEKQEEPPAAPAPVRDESPTAKRRFSRVPNQKGVPEGQTRWHCYDCGKSFLAPTDQAPEACPLPHPAA